MRLNVLHLDNALKNQPHFLEACAARNATVTDAQTAAARIRLWGKESDLGALRDELAPSFSSGTDTIVSFMGSGDFHHISALLIGMIAQTQREPFTVIHFDNHPDWVRFSGGMHCGSWVNRALATAQVDKVITIGVCSHDLAFPQFKKANLKAWRDEKIILLPWHSPSKQFRSHNIEHIDEQAFNASLASLIRTRNIYITIDKDVLSHTDAITNWDQGRMPLARLLGIVRGLLSRHHAIGMDVNGDYSPPVYAGRRRDVVLKKLESLLDQPRSPPSPDQAASVNQASNMALLQCICETI